MFLELKIKRNSKMKLYNQLKSEIIKNWQEMKKDRSLMLKNLSKALFLFSAISFIFNFGYFIFFLFSGLAINEKAKKFIIEKFNKKNFSNKRYIGIMLSIAFLGFIFSGDSDDVNKNVTKEKATASSSAKKQKTASEKKPKRLSAKEKTTMVLNSRDKHINDNLENLLFLSICTDTSGYSNRSGDRYYLGVYNGKITDRYRGSDEKKYFNFPRFEYNESTEDIDSNGFLKDYKSTISVNSAPVFIFYDQLNGYDGDGLQKMGLVTKDSSFYYFQSRKGAGNTGYWRDDKVYLVRGSGILRFVPTQEDIDIGAGARNYQCNAIENDTDRLNIMTFLYDRVQKISLKEYNSLKKSIEKGIKNRKF